MRVGVRGGSLMVGGEPDVCMVAEPYLVASWHDTMNSLQKQQLNMREKTIKLFSPYGNIPIAYPRYHGMGMRLWVGMPN